MGRYRRRPGRGEGEGGFGHREGATRLPSPSVSPRTSAGAESAQGMFFGPSGCGGGGGEGVCKQAPPLPPCTSPQRLPSLRSWLGQSWLLSLPSFQYARPPPPQHWLCYSGCPELLLSGPLPRPLSEQPPNHSQTSLNCQVVCKAFPDTRRLSHIPQLQTFMAPTAFLTDVY